MNIAVLIEHLGYEGTALGVAALPATWDAEVPHLQWNLRDIVTHVGGVHRWATDAVRSHAPLPNTRAGGEVGTGPEDDELLYWYREGHLDLLEALFSAPDNLRTFTFLPARSPKHFWIRRQAHETAIHRVDVQAATGEPITPVDTEFAQDGIAEHLGGFAQRRSFAIAEPGSVALLPDDGDAWLITYGGPRIEARSAADGANVTGASAQVRGTSSDLYLWLWNRPGAVEITGDAAVAERWASVRIGWA